MRLPTLPRPLSKWPKVRRSATGIGTASESAVATEDGELDTASLMEQFLNDPSHDYKSLKYGDVMDGVIMHLDREEILVDIGSKSEGIVPSREYSSLSPDERQALGGRRHHPGLRGPA